MVNESKHHTLRWDHADRLELRLKAEVDKTNPSCRKI